MRKKFKKPFIATFFVFLLLISPFLNKGGVEEVEAAKNCHTHTNYYFFSHVAGYNAYNDRSLPIQVSHSSYFSDELPEGAVIENAQYNWLDLANGEDGWTIRKFWTEDAGLPNDNGVFKNGDEWYFSHTLAWVNNDTNIESEKIVDPGKYNIEDVIKNSYYAPATNGAIPLQLQDSANNLIVGSIKRTIGTQWNSIKETVKAQTASDGSHPTDGQIWMPALLQVKFEVCETTPDKAPTPDKVPTPENKYNVIVKYVDDATNEEIREQTNLGSFKTGEDYLAECYDTIDDYTLTSQKEIGGTMANSDVTLYCRYNKEKEPTTDVPTFDLTINYLDKNTNEPIKDPYHDPNAYKSGDNYTAECLDSVGSGYILDSYIGNLTGTFADDDIVINCLYVTEPVQTSDIPLQIVFIVAAVALGYSIYYLVKYYKPQNMAK